MKSPEFFENEIVEESKNLTEDQNRLLEDAKKTINEKKAKLDFKKNGGMGLSEYEKKWAKNMEEPLDNQDPLNKFLNQKVIGEQANVKEVSELSKKEKLIKKLDDEIIADVKRRSEEGNTKKAEITK